MTLTPGTRIGVYEVTAQIGAGGMGEVYRATDSNLKRSVAIKVLPAALAGDTDRLARFQREAEVLAALNHPNIAAIYGLERSSDMTALVMELVDGEDLSQRITRGAIPLDEALPIAKQIADALEAAHEQGIIHRDLKPANIKVRPDGTVKVLDFGLAKAMDPVAGSAPSVSMSPTLSMHATQAGMILGTAAYMAPEQARGRTVDRRADVWAFGAVLFEMLTGRRAFDGDDLSITLAFVMTKDPDWAALPATTPAGLQRLLRRCLEKDPKQRLRDIGEARLALAAGFDAEPTVVTHTTPTAQQPRWRRVAVFSLPALIIGGVLTGGATFVVTRPVAPQPVRFAIVPPATQPLNIHGFQRDLAITPDGRHIVYRVGVGQGGNLTDTQLVVRALDQLDARVLTGITGIRSPFVSPDGHWIGFFAGGNNGELKKVSILGGPPITLCKVTGISREASWGPDGTIIFATSDPSTGLFRVTDGGGDPTVLTRPDAAHGEGDHIMPFALPGGRAVLFTITAPQGQPVDNAQIAVLDLQTGRKNVLIRGGNDARYADTGHLVYAAAGTLRAVRFDLKRLAVTSDPVPVVEQVTMSGSTGTADFGLAQNGTLVYVPGGVGTGGVARTLAWVNRQGREEPVKAPPRAYSVPRISPDGTRVALEVRDQESDIWVWDLTRETLARFTFDPGTDVEPVWTPDSRRIIYSSVRGGVANLYWQAADNTGAVERLTTRPNLQFPSSMSPDGTRVLFREFTPKTLGDVGMLTLTTGAATAPRLTQPLIQTRFNERNAEVSPDGRWVAYESDDSGVFQVYVRPFPSVDTGHWQVSTGGGNRPVWARSGRELFYHTNGALWAVTVQTTGVIFSAGNPAKLFDTGSYLFGSVSNPPRSYDVASDGQRFLVIKIGGQNATAPAPTLVVVEHWTEELKARVPAK